MHSETLGLVRAPAWRPLLWGLATACCQSMSSCLAISLQSVPIFLRSK